MSLHWFRARGITSPFSYRVYGQPQVGAGGPVTNESLHGSAIYCVPWLTGQGGAIDAIHTRHSGGTVDSATVAHWGIYAAIHARLVVPGGLLVATSHNITANVQSIALAYSATPNAMHYLAFAINTPIIMRRLENAAFIYPVLGVDSGGLNAHWGIAASYDVTNGLPATFPQTGWTFLGDASSRFPPFIGVHYA